MSILWTWSIGDLILAHDLQLISLGILDGVPALARCPTYRRPPAIAIRCRSFLGSRLGLTLEIEVTVFSDPGPVSANATALAQVDDNREHPDIGDEDLLYLRRDYSSPWKLLSFSLGILRHNP
jgi:hypothetical protein